MGICVCPLCGQSFFINNFYLKGELPLNTLLLLCAVILVACIIGSKISSRIGVPTLLIFIALGMLFGSDGILKIEFEDYAMAEKVCSAALIIIMFYGGFGTNWSMARPTAVKSVLLSTLGVILTAGLTGLFCHFVLKTDLLTGLLIGSVLGSTDAASVFSILRSKRLNLKYGTASMLEIESGSNDPCAYMLTIIVLSAMSGQLSAGGILYSIFAQIAYGIGAGVLFALLGGWVLRRIHLGEEGFQSIFLVALALASYALPSLLGGNGYLSTYITGIILGNQEIHRKRELVNFFDAFNSMMQMVIFLPASGIFPTSPGNRPLSHPDRPSGGGRPAAYALSRPPSSAAFSFLGRTAGRGLHRVLHHGGGFSLVRGRLCIPYRILRGSAVPFMPGNPASPLFQKAGYD